MRFQPVFILFFSLSFFRLNAQDNWHDSLLVSLFKTDQSSIASFEQEQIALSNSRSKLYLNKDWVEGSVIPKGTGGIKLSGIRLRYRVYDDQMQVEHKGRTYTLNPEKTESVILGWQLFVYESFELDDFKSKSYFQKLNQGKISLLKRWKMAIKRSDYDPRMNTGIKEDIIFPETEYFIKKPNQPALRFKKKKKTLFRLLPEFKGELKSVIRKEKLKLKREEDIIRMIDYCNGR